MAAKEVWAAKPDGADAPSEEAVLKLPDGREHRIKVLRPTFGDDLFLDIRDLHAKTGCFTFDPGYTCTGSCMSAITFIDGPKGVCLYRGYPVQELCERGRALEVAYLILVGELPTPAQWRSFSVEIKRHMMVHEKVKAMFSNFTINAHPMAIMVAVVGALSCIYSELDHTNHEHQWLACTRLIAQLPTLACMSYKTAIGEPIMYPKTDLTFAENFLYMMFATPMEEYRVNKVHAKAINAFMILHMDHEQNASTSTVRIAGSSQANPYACIAAGIASLWGPAHGGANEAVIKMLEQIGTVDKVEQFVADVKAKTAGVRLMGFGHRVYKNYDPRARFMRKLVGEILNELGVSDPLLAVARELERVALEDEYFQKRKLYPNVDFYSGIMLKAIGIPTSMFTVMFAMARTVGWVTQWKEMVSEGQMRIGRPRQLYVGVEMRECPPMEAPKGYPELGVRPKNQSFSQEQAKMEKDGGARVVHGSYLARRGSSFKMSVPHVTTR
uniref:Citrate synthase n=1 Tax=Alexandrium monilatum TaxID=311494 RepID=A0A7S4SP55_9DINO|mmetsp:Transcript_57704/g.171699  ORF Transcript_57704/g.171699 Transcript_57704/m.171699 type:complete len:498 (-) Transcript_57704:235-1728(-)